MYRKILSFAIVLVASFSIFLPAKTQAGVEDFKINSFTADYYLKQEADKSSTLDVTEQIVAEFPNYNQNHGILRSIPESYQDHTVSLEVNSVTNETGQPYRYTTSYQNNNQVLKIGDPNTYVLGQATYVIKYRLRNVISFPNDKPQTSEFYWDVNGVEWPQTMGNVTARLHVPNSLKDELTGDRVCYAGIAGAKNRQCTISKDQTSDETVITASALDLYGYENLSMVVGFKGETFAYGPEVAAEQNQKLLLLILSLVVALIFPFLTLIYCYSRWRRVGKDPKGKGVIVSEYVPPKNLNVVSSAFLLTKNFTPKACSAGIIDLAVQGYLRINETEKKKLFGKSTEYEIEVMKDTTGLKTEQQSIVNALFSGGVSVGSKTNISQQKNKLFTTIQKVNNHLGSSMTKDGYFNADPVKARQGFVVKGVVLLFAGMALGAFLPVAIGLVISALIVLIFSVIMPSRTELGVETRDYLKGLEMYIKLAEKDRIAYLQSPQGAERKTIDPNDPKQQIKLFEDLLPYAMIFGLEKKWAEQFKDLYQQPPNWYNGNVNNFNSIYLVSSLNSFSSSNNRAFSAPSSSSSSGFGGGGFSGGGGGGGGGGGW